MTNLNPWARLTFDMMALGAESSGVMALRMMKFAAGGPAAATEANLMVAEKLRAVAEIQAQAWSDALTGKSDQTATRAVRLYRRKVRANRRRLTKA